MKINPRIITILCLVVFTIGISYISGLLKLLGLHLGLVQYVSLILMICLVLSFLIHPIKRGIIRDKLPWYDILFIIMSIAGAGYPAFFIHRWSQFLYLGKATMLEVVLCFMLLVTVLESARRMIGLAMPLVGSFFIIHLIFGDHFPSLLLTPRFSFQRITSLFYLSPDGIFGIALQVSCNVVIMFMFFTAFLRKSDAGDYITDTALALTGRWTGGPAKGAVLASSVLGTITGDTVVNVATTGTFTIPLMKRAGYRPEFAGAVEAVASNGGQIMPPVMGMVAFIMADLLTISYWQICVAAALPALLYYISLYFQVHLEAVKYGLTGLPREHLPNLKKSIKGGVPYIIPIVVLVYYLAVVRVPAEFACLNAWLALLGVVLFIEQALKKTRMGLKERIIWVVDCIKEGVKSLLLPTSACAIAGIIIGSVASSGLGNRLSGMLIDLAGGNVMLLLVFTAISSFILGMGMTSVPCYLILAVIVGPTLKNLGVPPIAAHLFFFYFGIVSFITPPVAVAAFVASGIAQSDPIRTGIIATRLGIVTFIVPFVFVFNPALLLMGPVKDIVVSFMAAAIGVSLLAAALEGITWRRLKWLERMALAAASLLLLWPDWRLNIGGLIIALPLLLWQLKASKQISINGQYKNKLAGLDESKS